MKRERNYSLFSDKSWAFWHYDGRRREFRGWSREEFYAAQEKHWKRAGRSVLTSQSIYEYRRKKIAIFAEIPYEYHKGRYQRRSDNVVLYIAVRPGGIAQVFTHDPLLVDYLTKKYNKHFANK